MTLHSVLQGYYALSLWQRYAISLGISVLASVLLMRLAWWLDRREERRRSGQAAASSRDLPKKDRHDPD